MIRLFKRINTLVKEHPLVEPWYLSKNSKIWILAILFIATEYFADIYRITETIPFNYDLFTGTLLTWYQRLLHIPIFIMAYMIFVKNWSWRGLGVVSLAVWLTTNYALIDVELHNILTYFDLYPKIWHMPNGETNSNYAKIIVFMVITVLFLLRFLQRSYRTMTRFLTLLMAISLTSTAILFHWVLIDREYKQVVGHEMDHIRAVLPVSEKAFREVCANSTWECWLGFPSINGNPQVTPMMRKDMRKMMVGHGCENHPCIIMSGGTNPFQNEFIPIPMGVMKVDGTWRFIADTSRTAHQFLEIRQGLTSLGLVAGNVWTYGLILLWALHQRQWKKRKAKDKK